GATIAFTSAGLTGATSNTFNIPAPAPANDLCASPTALTINGGNQSGTTVGATYTSLTNEPFPAFSDVWYTFTPGSSGNITITTSTTGVDYDLYVYSTCPSSAISYVTGGDAANAGSTSETLTFSATSGTTYFIRVVNTTSTAGSTFTINATMPLAPPTLTAAVGATVDAPFNVTFADDPTWRAAITSITVGGVTLTAGSAVSAGQITFTPSASTPTSLLQSSGSKSIVVIATGYTNATVTQAISAGTPTNLGITTQPTAPATNGGSLAVQPVVVIRDQYNNLTASTATVTAAVGAGTWTIGGTTSRDGVSGTATFSGLTATSAAAVTGATIVFTCAGLTDITSNTFNIIAPPVAPTVTTPTSASIVNTTATLGGNVTSNGGATITARGVVWSAEATNSNPTIG
ncbi:MAG: hemoblobin-interacting domain-containing protein, partial [Dolichospermum sp.]